MSIISEVEEALAVVKALEGLAANGQVQVDIKALIADVEQAKALFEDVKAKVEDILSQLGPEIKALLPKITGSK